MKSFLSSGYEFYALLRSRPAHWTHVRNNIHRYLFGFYTKFGEPKYPSQSQSLLYISFRCSVFLFDVAIVVRNHRPLLVCRQEKYDEF